MVFRNRKYEYSPENILPPAWKLIPGDRADWGVPLAPQNPDCSVTGGATPAWDTGASLDNKYWAKRYDDATSREPMLGLPVKPMSASGTNDNFAGLGGGDRKISIVYRGPAQGIFSDTGSNGSDYHTGAYTYVGMPLAPTPSGFKPLEKTGEYYAGYCTLPGASTGEMFDLYLECRRRMYHSGGVYY